MSYFHFNNQRVYYYEFGAGAPLLFLHGNAASSNMFYEIAERYKNDFKVILIDFLGHGQSDRLDEFPADLWFDEAEQVIALLKEKRYTKVNLIGSSGGALAAINVALEAPELIAKVIADSFEGESSLKEITENIAVDREASKQEENARMFYYYMHGDDWERVVDCDTAAIIRHAEQIGKFFRKDLHALNADILLTGSKEDEFVSMLALDYFERTFGAMLEKIGHGKAHLFPTGGHPAMLSNSEEFYQVSMEFLKI